MITKKQWNNWVDLINSYTKYHGIRNLTEKEILKAMLKYTTNAESLVTCFTCDKKIFEKYKLKEE
jgi:hypothetical protein